MAIFGLALFFGMLFCLPETLRTQDKPQDKRMESPELSDDELPAREDEPTEENPKGRNSKEVTKFDF